MMSIGTRGSSHRLAFVIAMSLVFQGFVASGQETPSGQSKPSVAISVSAVPQHLVNGGPVFFRVTTPAPLRSLKGTWLGHEVVFDHGKGNHWFLLAAVSLGTPPGTVPLILQETREDGSVLELRHDFIVGKAKYPIVHLTVSKQFTEPSPQQQATIKQDQDIKHKTFSEVSAERLWSGRFLAPVNAPISDVFGTRRVFNGVTKSVHQGLDYRVPAATPVNAINSGTVILAQSLYFEGNCVTIDHGQGLLSLYLHLSELKVKEGDHVESNQEIGLSGATGRATGPHLHIAVRWQGIYLDPAALLGLALPGD
jgi:murein DD-endopeptidase MepM/ murein hydrolase activator NlpD